MDQPRRCPKATQPEALLVQRKPMVMLYSWIIGFTVIRIFSCFILLSCLFCRRKSHNNRNAAHRADPFFGELAPSRVETSLRF
jgi:hypothetical protein